MATNREIFDQIAPGWYGFRHHTIFPHELGELALRWKSGRLLNLGCGHGADFIPFKQEFDLFGMDFSRKMLEMAMKYATKFEFDARLAQADLRALPYADSSFEWAVAVASYHHLAKTDHVTAFRELLRVLKPGGEAFITVWNRHQRRFWFRRREIHVPWRSGKVTYGRYHYLFSYGEIQQALKRAGFIVVSATPEQSWRFPLKWFSRNICVLVRKP